MGAATLVTANWRFFTGHEDTWAKVEPQIVTPPQWYVYYLEEDDRSDPSGVAVTVINGAVHVVVSHTQQDSVGFYDAAGHVIYPPGVEEAGDYPMGIDITEDPENPGGYYALVACRDEDSVAVISFASGLVDKWYAGNEPVDLRAVSVNEEWKCYVVNKTAPLQNLGKVTVLDWGGSIDTSFNVGVRPMAIDNAPAGSPFEDRIYVVNNGSSNVYCIDMDNNNAIIDTLRIGAGSPTPASPVDVAIAPSAQNNQYRGIVINTANKSVYVFTLNRSRPWHTKNFEESSHGMGNAESIHSVTVIEEESP